MGEHKRHQMMQNLFGDQSEEEEEEIDSEHESNPQPGYISVRSPPLFLYIYFINFEIKRCSLTWGCDCTRIHLGFFRYGFLIDKGMFF